MRQIRKKIEIYSCVGFFLILSGSHLLFASDEKTELNQKIKALQEKITEQEANEALTLDLLQDIDQEMALTRQHIQKLKQEEQTRLLEIAQTESRLLQTERELVRLKSLLEKRAVYLYKHSQVRDIEILFSVDSFNQILLWLKYQKILAENDQRNIRNIEKKQTTIAGHKTQLRQLWNENQNLLSTKGLEGDRLQQRKTQRQKVLAGIRKNIKNYQQEVENSLAQIQQLVRAEEKARQTIVSEIPVYSEFPELKGKLSWPIRGKIIKNFGDYRHPELKTITKSLGVDIHASPGVPVRAVASGVISRIQWMRGIGVLILLNHNGGYYTVYANLGEVFVRQDEHVLAGHVLGNVGEPGIDNQARLHFEIWEKNTPVNPVKWLQR